MNKLNNEGILISKCMRSINLDLEDQEIELKEIWSTHPLSNINLKKETL